MKMEDNNLDTQKNLNSHLNSERLRELQRAQNLLKEPCENKVPHRFPAGETDGYRHPEMTFWISEEVCFTTFHLGERICRRG